MTGSAADSSLTRPPAGLSGLDPSWSREVVVPDASGTRHRWHVLDNGAEPTSGTVLCVHGNPTWSYLWRRFLDGAPAGWRVVAPDQLGMGWSQRLAAPRTLAERIADLDALTEALGITGPVVLVAHDWGGPIGLGWALRHTGQLLGVVLANTAVALDGGEPPGLIRLARSAPLLKAVCVDTSAFVRGATALSRPELSRSVRDGFASPYRTASRRRAVADFVADIPVEPDHRSRTTLDGVAAGLPRLADIPTLLLWGPKDPVFSDAYLNDLLGRLPHADVHRYPKASHLVTEDAPQAAEHAWRWISELTDRSDPPEGEFDASETPPPLGAAIAARGDDPGVATVELSGEDKVVTSFRELEGRIASLAAGLTEGGVRPGDRIALLIRPGLDLTATVYACWRVGAVIVLADAGLGVRNLASALRSANPDHVIAIPAGLAVVAALKVPGRRIVAGDMPAFVRRALGVRFSLQELVDRGQTLSAGSQDRALSSSKGESSSHPEASDDTEEAAPLTLRQAQGANSSAQRSDDIAAVLFTSGATGPSKGVVYRHGQLSRQLELMRLVMRIGPDDRLVAAFAPFALYGPALGVAASVPDMDVTKPGTLTATALAEAVLAVDATVLFASPAALRNVVSTAGDLTAEQRKALGGVRTVLSAGAPVPVGLLRKVQGLLPHAELHTPYGMTEVLPVTDISLAQIEAAGSGNGVCVGLPVPGVQIAISALDASGEASGPLETDVDVTGEICVSAAHRKDHYDRLWATERESSRELGWHRTGDVGHLDVEGRLWVEGRLVHVITAPDGPLTPVGVEQRVEELPDVRAAAAVGVGPAGTQQLVLIVVEEQPAGKGPLANPRLAAEARSAAGVDVAAVLTVPALPTDIRHASKVDRLRLAGWAEKVLRGARVGRP